MRTARVLVAAAGFVILPNALVGARDGQCYYKRAERSGRHTICYYRCVGGEASMTMERSGVCPSLIDERRVLVDERRVRDADDRPSPRYKFTSPLAEAGLAMAEALAKQRAEDRLEQREQLEMDIQRQANARDAERHEAEMKRLQAEIDRLKQERGKLEAQASVSDADRLEAVRQCSNHVRDVGPDLLEWLKADLGKRASEAGVSSMETAWDFIGHFNGEMRRCFIEAKAVAVIEEVTLTILNVYDAFEGHRIGHFASLAERGKTAVTIESQVLGASVDEAVYRALMRK